MTLEDISNILNAKILCKAERVAEIDVPKAFACDLMSDVLALCSPEAVLLTGLTNVQIIRTAQMLDIPGVIFVRGKMPMEETIILAEESNIPIIVTNLSMFQACGILYGKGVKPCLRTNYGE